MNRISKAILIAFGVLAALVVVVMVCVNLYLQSPGVQARIQGELSRVMRMPLTITSTSFTPWSDLRISGITIPHGERKLLEASSFTASYRVAPLLQKRLVIHSLLLDQPKIVWAQNSDGEWVLPVAEAAATAPPLGEEGAAVTTSETVSREGEQAPVLAGETSEATKSNLEVILEGGRIKNGTIELLDKAGQPVATLTGVTLDFTTLTEQKIEGSASITRAVWENSLVLSEVKTPFSYTEGKLDLPALDARLGDGYLKGQISWNPAIESSPFTSQFDFEHIDLGRIGKDAGWTATEVTGALRGTLALQGSAKQMERAEGNAKLFLRNGRFQNLFYFELIGQALQIKELSDLRLGDSEVELRFADEKAFIERMSLDAANLQLSGTGLLRIDGKIQFAARLVARERLFKQLPSFARDNFSTGEDNSRFIDFNITGKTAKPKTDLLNKVVGRKIETQFDDLLSSLFKTESKDDNRKKDDKKKNKEKEKEKEREDQDDASLVAPVTEDAAAPQ